MNEELKNLIQQYIEEQSSATVRGLMSGVVFDQIVEGIWRKLVSQAVMELVDESRIRMIEGYLYVPVVSDG